MNTKIYKVLTAKQKNEYRFIAPLQVVYKLVDHLKSIWTTEDIAVIKANQDGEFVLFYNHKGELLEWKNINPVECERIIKAIELGL